MRRTRRRRRRRNRSRSRSRSRSKKRSEQGDWLQRWTIWLTWERLREKIPGLFVAYARQ